MVEPKIVKGGQFVQTTDKEGNPQIQIKQKTQTYIYDMVFREWKKESESIEFVDVETRGFVKKLSFSILWKRKLGFKGQQPYGLGTSNYEYLVRKVTVSVKPDFWSVYLTAEPFGIPKRRMGNVIMRDFFHAHGYGTEIISYSKTPAGHPLKVRESKWKVISEEKANEIYSTGKALLVGRVQEENGITTYSFGGELKPVK